MCPSESDLQPPERRNLLDSSGHLPPPTPLRDLAPFSRGEKIGYGVAAALWLLIPLLLLWGDHAWDSCRLEAGGGETDLCGLAMALAVFAAIVVGAAGLIVAGVTAWRRARRLRREHRLPEATDG